MHARRHVLDADRDAGARGMVGELNQRSPEGRSTARLLVFIGQAAGMNDQAGSPGGGEPIDAAHQVVDRFLMRARVGRTQVNAAGADGLPAPAAVGAMDLETVVLHAISERERIGKSVPAREDFQHRDTEAPGQFELVVELDRAVVRR